jgi:hypothetical protein
MGSRLQLRVVHKPKYLSWNTAPDPQTKCGLIQQTTRPANTVCYVKSGAATIQRTPQRASPPISKRETPAHFLEPATLAAMA